MIDFKPLLVEISQNLKIPQPGKSRILLEIKSDIEDTFAFYIASGMNETEAFNAVCEKFKPSKQSIDALTAIYQPAMMRWLDRLAGHTLGVWEKAAFFGLLAAVLLPGGRLIFSTPLIIKASPFIWPILAAGVGVFIIGIVKTYKLYIKKDHNTRTLRNGLSGIFFLGAGALCLAVFGYYWELFRIGSINMLLETKLYLICLTDKAFAGSIDIITEWMVRSSAMIFASLPVFLASALLWFLLINKIIRIENMEAETYVAIHTDSA